MDFGYDVTSRLSLGCDKDKRSASNALCGGNKRNGFFCERRADLEIHHFKGRTEFRQFFTTGQWLDRGGSREHSLYARIPRRLDSRRLVAHWRVFSGFLGSSV